MAPTGSEIDMSLSFSITSRFAPSALFSASNAMPALIAPSPITATTWRLAPPSFAAVAIPNAHKILTGRRAQMSKLRQWGGPAGFPRRDESPYDTFGTAHSSTSISAALGMAIAARLAGAKRHVVAVIGDGAMSAGMAFEALNNAEGANLLVVLNDNDMSISEPVGAINQYFAKVLASRFYNTMRRGGKEVLSKLGPVHEIARRAEEHVKGMVLDGTLFEEFGFNYIGPVDGHDLEALVDTLANIRNLSGPQFLHVVTRKG